MSDQQLALTADHPGCGAALVWLPALANQLGIALWCGDALNAALAAGVDPAAIDAPDQARPGSTPRAVSGRSGSPRC